MAKSNLDLVNECDKYITYPALLSHNPTIHI